MKTFSIVHKQNTLFCCVINFMDILTFLHSFIFWIIFPFPNYFLCNMVFMKHQARMLMMKSTRPNLTVNCI